MPKDGHDTIPHYIKSSVVTPDDWKRVKAERFRLDDPARIADVAALKQQHPPTRELCPGSSLRLDDRQDSRHAGRSRARPMPATTTRKMIEEHGGGPAACWWSGIFDQVLSQIDFDYARAGRTSVFKNGPIVSVDFYKNVITAALQADQQAFARGGDLTCGTPTATATCGRFCRACLRAGSTASSRTNETVARIRRSCWTNTTGSCEIHGRGGQD